MTSTFTNDERALEAKLCPDCGTPIKDYFFTPDKPFCKRCDVWFTRNGEWWERNQDATHHYNRKWQEALKNKDTTEIVV